MCGPIKCITLVGVFLGFSHSLSSFLLFLLLLLLLLFLLSSFIIIGGLSHGCFFKEKYAYNSSAHAACYISSHPATFFFCKNIPYLIGRLLSALLCDFLARFCLYITTYADLRGYAQGKQGIFGTDAGDGRCAKRAGLAAWTRLITGTDQGTTGEAGPEGKLLASTAVRQRGGETKACSQ